MDKRKDAERARLARAKQEDRALNRALILIAGAAVLEGLLLTLNRYYVNYTAADIAVAQSILGVLKVLVVVVPLCFVGMLAWLLMSWKNRRGMLLPGVCAGFFAALTLCTLVARFSKDLIPTLYVAVPVAAVLGLVYYLYQREFFLVASACAGGLLGVWLIQRGTGRYALAIFLVLAAAALVGAVVLAYLLQRQDGALKLGEKKWQVLPHNANYRMIYITCGVVAVVLAAALAVGGHILLYAVLVAWLLILAVYYTVKLM